MNRWCAKLAAVGLMTLLAIPWWAVPIVWAGPTSNDVSIALTLDEQIDLAQTDTLDVLVTLTNNDEENMTFQYSGCLFDLSLTLATENSEGGYNTIAREDEDCEDEVTSFNLAGGQSLEFEESLNVASVDTGDYRLLVDVGWTSITGQTYDNNSYLEDATATVSITETVKTGLILNDVPDLATSYDQNAKLDYSMVFENDDEEAVTISYTGCLYTQALLSGEPNENGDYTVIYEEETSGCGSDMQSFDLEVDESTRISRDEMIDLDELNIEPGEYTLLINYGYTLIEGQTTGVVDEFEDIYVTVTVVGAIDVDLSLDKTEYSSDDTIQINYTITNNSDEDYYDEGCTLGFPALYAHMGETGGEDSGEWSEYIYSELETIDISCPEGGNLVAAAGEVVTGNVTIALESTLFTNLNRDNLDSFYINLYNVRSDYFGIDIDIEDSVNYTLTTEGGGVYGMEENFSLQWVVVNGTDEAVTIQPDGACSFKNHLGVIDSDGNLLYGSDLNEEDACDAAEDDIMISAGSSYTENWELDDVPGFDTEENWLMPGDYTLRGYESEATFTITAPLSDVDNHWGEQYIYELYMDAVISGYSDATFRPDQSVTRAEFLKIVMEGLGMGAMAQGEGESVDVFDDVTTEHWAYWYVRSASDLGYVTGYDDGTFRPEDTITRAEAMAILIRALGIVDETEYESIFTDVTVDWQIPYVMTAYDLGLISGYMDSEGNLTGEFGPNNELTRAEAAKIVVKARSM